MVVDVFAWQASDIVVGVLRVGSVHGDLIVPGMACYGYVSGCQRKAGILKLDKVPGDVSPKVF